jgi:4-hydroxybenzoyl-CoA thioesterase
MGQLFHVDVPVRFSYCDPAGIVYFPQFFNLINSLLEDWFTQGLSTPYPDLIMKQRLGTPTLDIQCKFIKPCRYGEILTLELRVTRIGHSSFHLAEEGKVAGELRWRSRHVLCFMSNDTYRAVPIPEPIREKMKLFVV